MKLENILLSSLAAASSCYASPARVLDLSPVNSPDTELLIHEGIKLARSQDVEKRVSADFSLERSWNNEVLFGGAWNDTEPGSSEHAKLSVTCLECYTKGTVSAKVTDKHFLHPLLRLGFSGVEAYAFLGVDASAGQTFSLNLFASDSPIGIGIKGLDVGVVFFVDLVFSLSEAIDLTAGFQVTVPDDAYLEADIFKGDIDDSAFAGLNSQSLPVTVVSGHATFKADLRLRVQAGAEASIDLFGIGAGAVVGIYANIIEFVAVIDKTPTCDLETEIWWDLNVGAYAHLDVVVDYTTLGPVPTVSTTLLTAPTISSCWIEAPTTPALPATTSEAAVSTPAYTPPVVSSSPAETGAAGITTSATATGAAPTTDSTLVWSPSFVLSVTASEVTFTMSDELPTFIPSSFASASASVPSSDTSAASPTTATSLASSSNSQGVGSSVASASSVYYSSSVAATGHSQGASTYSGSVSSVYYSPSAAASSYSYAPGTYPVPISSYSSSAAAAGPTYTSTYTHTMTICGAPGVMNCPATYQTEVIVTRTTTICPATSTTAVVSTGVGIVPAPTVSSKPAGGSHSGGEVVVVILTPLPTPVVETFVAPTETTTTTVHVGGYTEVAAGQSTTTGTVTSTTTITATASHGGFQTPVIAEPSPSVNVPVNTTVVGTGFVPGATQSGGSPAGSQTPIIAGADRLSVLGSTYSAYFGALTTLVVAFLIGVL